MHLGHGEQVSLQVVIEFRPRGDDMIRSRRVLVRNSLENTESFSYRRGSVRDGAIGAYEKEALDERQSLIDDYDEDAEERSIYVSEKHLEAGFSTSGDGKSTSLEKRLVRKSVGFRWLKKPGRGEQVNLHKDAQRPNLQ